MSGRARAGAWLELRLGSGLGSSRSEHTLQIQRLKTKGEREGVAHRGFTGETTTAAQSGCVRGLRGLPGRAVCSYGRGSARGSTWRSQRGFPCLRAAAASTSSAHGQRRPAAEGNGARVSRGGETRRGRRGHALIGTDAEGKGAGRVIFGEAGADVEALASACVSVGPCCRSDGGERDPGWAACCCWVTGLGPLASSSFFLDRKSVV